MIISEASGDQTFALAFRFACLLRMGFENHAAKAFYYDRCIDIGPTYTDCACFGRRRHSRDWETWPRLARETYCAKHWHIPGQRWKHQKERLDHESIVQTKECHEGGLGALVGVDADGNYFILKTYNQ